MEALDRRSTTRTDEGFSEWGLQNPVIEERGS
jgi:hypothetical protein